MKKINVKTLVASVLIPVVLGGIIGLLTTSSNVYQEIMKPSFAPPGIIFPIVWTILYILMGVSGYLVYESNKENQKAQKAYIVQLLINLIWPILFFLLKAYFVSFLWLLLLILFVIKMILEFYKVNKTAAYLQIPYLLWLLFAGILNFSIYILNK